MTKTIIQNLETLQVTAMQKIEDASTRQSLEELRLQVVGKKGELTTILKGLKDVPPEERSEVGGRANQIKTQLMQAMAAKEEQLKREEWEAQQAAEHVDITLPGLNTGVGAIHPINLMSDTLIDLFARLGFSCQESNEIETDFYNFEALNIPESHPARDMHDTFYLNGGRLLRTHTSPGQIHAMKTQDAPIKIIVPGKVFRCDADVSHSPVFNQIEGLYVGKQVSFAELKGLLTYFLQEIFGADRQIRFRPSYFPFTEPSLEVDIEWSKDPETGEIKWLEVMGAGMVHRNVFKSVGYDPETVSGFAFGIGIDRIAMLKYEIPDIRLLYENDLRFVRQFR